MKSGKKLYAEAAKKNEYFVDRITFLIEYCYSCSVLLSDFIDINMLNL